MQWDSVQVAGLVVVEVEGGCLGKGTGAGSCPAAPFRADPADIDHKSGCPAFAECCTEYGYCHPKVSSLVGFSLVFCPVVAQCGAAPPNMRRGQKYTIFTMRTVYSNSAIPSGAAERC